MIYDIRIGDTARFPIGRLGSDEEVYKHTFEVIAVKHGELTMRRMADGFTKTVSDRFWEQYAIEPRWLGRQAVEAKATARKAALLPIRARRIAEAKASLQTDKMQPGFYVSARKGPKHALLLGPFVDHYSALQMVAVAWPIVRTYDDPWMETSVGTCKIASSKTLGKFNKDVFLV